MSKPEDIPQDVWEAAISAVYAGRGRISTKDAPTFERVARAIMAEREACAEEANGVDPLIFAPMSEGAVSVYCRSRCDAAAAIRKRGEG